MAIHDRDYWREREILAARKIGHDRPHPDYCPKLILGGVEWSIPPRGGVVPVFDGESVQLCGGAGEWEPLVEKVLAGAPIDNGETSSATAATAAVISAPSIAAGSLVSIDFDAVGTGGVGAKVYLTLARV